jgi:hypothetical protein
LPAKRKHTAVTVNVAPPTPMVCNSADTPALSHPREKSKHQVVVDQLNGMVRAQSVKLASVLAEKEWAFAELTHTREKLSGSLECNTTIQKKYNDLLTVSMEEIGNLNARLSCLEIEKKGLSRNLAKVTETSKQKDYRIRSLQESKSNHDVNIQTVSDGGSAFSALIKQLVESKVTGPIIVSNVLDSLVARKKLHSHIKNYLTLNDFLQQTAVR